MTIAKIIYHPITLLVITIIGVVFFFSLDKSSKKMQVSSKNIETLEKEVNIISKDVINLEEKIEKVESPHFKEKVVRNELLLQKEGEYILKIPDVSEKNNEEKCENNCDVSSSITPISAWKKLLLY